MDTKNKFTPFLALLLCACMIFSTFQAIVYAEDEHAHNDEVVSYADSATKWTPTGSNSYVKYLSDMNTVDSLEGNDVKTNTTYVESGHYIRKDKNDQSN